MNCKHCGKSFSKNDYRQKFCSKSCSASYSNSRRLKKQYVESGKLCLTCTTPLKKYQTKFCSSKCDGQFRKNETEKKLINGISVSTSKLRSYLISTIGYKCEICKGTEWFGKPMPVTMDHIDGNASNNNLDNLRLICPNCDRFTPTFGYRNKGNGRQSRGIKRFDKYDK